MQAFIEENGYTASHYEDYYKGKMTWESELTGWLGANGLPCLAWVNKPYQTGSLPSGTLYNQGLEMDESTSIFFVMKWL
jgi:hypothetical protein